MAHIGETDIVYANVLHLFFPCMSGKKFVSLAYIHTWWMAFVTPWSFLLTPSKLQSSWLKQFEKLKSQKDCKLCIQMQFLSLIPYIAKIANFSWKNTDISRIEGVCQMGYIFLGSSLGKI